MRKIVKPCQTHTYSVRIFFAYPETVFKNPSTGEVETKTRRVTCRHIYLEGLPECPAYLDRRVKVTATFRCTASREDRKDYKGPLHLLGGYWSFSWHAKRYVKHTGPWDKTPARESEEYHHVDTFPLGEFQQELSRYLGNEVALEALGELLYDEPERKKK